MLEEFSFEMDIVSELNKERKPIHILKERYPDLYQLKANFYDRVLDISQTKKLEREYQLLCGGLVYLHILIQTHLFKLRHIIIPLLNGISPRMDFSMDSLT